MPISSPGWGRRRSSSTTAFEKSTLASAFRAASTAEQRSLWRALTTLPSLAPALLETDADGLTPEQQTSISIHLAFDAGRVWCHACERLTTAGVHCGECGKRHEEARAPIEPKKCRTPGCDTYVATRFCLLCGKEQGSEIERRIAAGEERKDVIADVTGRAQPGVKASLAQLDAFLKKHGKPGADAPKGRP